MPAVPEAGLKTETQRDTYLPLDPPISASGRLDFNLEICMSQHFTAVRLLEQCACEELGTRVSSVTWHLTASWHLTHLLGYRAALLIACAVSRSVCSAWACESVGLTPESGFDIEAHDAVGQTCAAASA